MIKFYKVKIKFESIPNTMNFHIEIAIFRSNFRFVQSSILFMSVWVTFVFVLITFFKEANKKDYEVYQLCYHLWWGVWFYVRTQLSVYICSQSDFEHASV